MIPNHRTTIRAPLLAVLIAGGNLAAQIPTATWKAIAPAFPASFDTPFVNDAGQAAYGNKTNGFSLGSVGAPVQRTLQTFIASAGLGLDVNYCVAGENGRVGYLLERGLVDDVPGAQKILAARDGQVPGLPAGAKFAALTFQNGDGTPRYFAMSPPGIFVLPAVLAGTGVAVSGGKAINDQAVLRGPAADFKIIARAGDAAPGLVDGFVFAGQATRRFDAVVNRSGVTAIRARAVHWNPPSPFPLQNAEGIWLHDPAGGLRLAVTAVSQGADPLGDTAPGTDGARFTDVTQGPAITDWQAVGIGRTNLGWSTTAS